MSRSFEAADGEVAACRRFVGNAMAAWGIDVADDVMLLTNELATNAVIHARGSFRVVLTLKGSRIRVAVSDDNTRLPELPHVPLEALSGRGLSMVVAMAKVWGIDPEDTAGKTIWFELEVRASR